MAEQTESKLDETVEEPLDDTLADTREKRNSTALMPYGAGPASDPDEASLHDVASVAGRYARGRFARLRAFLAGHILITALICSAILLAILAGILFTRRFVDYPSTELVTQDARSRLSRPSYEPSTFDTQDALVLSSVEVTGMHKEPAEPDECTVSVALGYANGSVESTQQVTLSYTRQEDEWRCVDVSKPGDVVYLATDGVSDGRLMAGIDDVLRKAETSFSQPADEGSSDLSLLTLYRSADITVVDRDFDPATQTYTARLHLARTATFTAYECDVTAGFAFRQGNGKWELTEATAEKGAKTLVLTPLVGTWQGVFLSQDAEQGKCLGARTLDLTVTISAVEGGHIAGTLSGLAHFHAQAKEDAETSDGDAGLEDVTFTGSLDSSSSGISFTCTTPEDTRGVVTLRLDFGEPDDPSAARATLTTTSAYEDVFLFVPYQREARYADTYSLSKS